MATVLKTVSIATLSAIALVACTEEPDKAQKGAAIGAGIGLISGILTDDDSNGKIKRTLAGAAIGGLIGNELDKQEEELRSSLNGTGVEINRVGGQLVVTLPEDITFDTDSTVLRPSLQNVMIELSQSLNKYPDTVIDLVGHTDNVGSTAYNQNLSTRRAQAVQSELIFNGVSSERIRAYGRSEQMPIASNDTFEGRAANRRVEIIITPRQ
ncbi:membrane protein [Amylibacter marinus]|uniref:Membrane protein n=1 Tax=Amylibacter marinus TaxID=1475483 RepID=A0ABQ5VVR8_9RHOB|nr:OmpA family protein [Amylibacter marinus]GLQ35239.1 membrane protein [Amylibacter marinus]